MFYVYGYYEPGCSDPFYIGKGSGRRWMDHLLSKNLKLDSFFYRKLRKMVESGVYPWIKKIKENLTEDEAFELEISLILKYGRRDLDTGCLCNLTDGGDGYSNLGRKFSYDARINMSKAAKLRDNDVQIKAMREACSDPIKSYDPVTGLTVKRYSSVREASRDHCCSPNTIRKCLGRGIKYAGMYWDHCS